MKFSEMKLQVTNALRAYFIRNWTMEDLMNRGEIPEPAYTSLKKIEESRFFESVISVLTDVSEDQVYLTLFCAMASFTFGSFLHLIWEAGGLFTVLSSMASLLCLDFTSPLRVKTRVSLMLYAASNLGASFGLFMNYFPEMHQNVVVGFLAGPTLGIGAVWLDSLYTRERSEIYRGCLIYSWAPTYATFVASISDFIDSHTAHLIFEVCTVLAWFLGYIVLYSQEILYDAQFGEINFLDRALTAFLHLPAIVVHAARLFLGAEIEQHRQN